MVAAIAAPHPLCPLHDLHAGALCSSHTVCMGRRGCRSLFRGAGCMRRCKEEEGFASPSPVALDVAPPLGVELGRPMLLCPQPLPIIYQGKCRVKSETLCNGLMKRGDYGSGNF